MCDDHGNVYFSPNIGSSPSSSTQPPEQNQEWSHVGNGFDCIVAGYCGIVCGIKDSSLYVRRSVTYMQPMGSKWDQHFCDVEQVMVGKEYIVRKSSLGLCYYTRQTTHSLSFGVLEWSAVESFVEQEAPDSNSDALIHHYAVDIHDRLYGMTLSGRVVCYKLLDEEPCWSVVSQLPPRPKRTTKAGQLVGWISSIWRSSNNSNSDTSTNGSRISKVSVGKGSIWCLMEDHSEIWQLVISELKHTTKWNWVKSVLPLDKDEEVLHFEACKSSVDRLYVALRKRGLCKMLSYSLNSKDNGRCEVVYPSKHPCQSLAIAGTVKLKPMFCCEDGSCSFCCKNSLSPGRKRDNEIHSLALIPEKKARLDYRSNLLNGVQFYFNKSFMTQQVSCTEREPESQD